MLEIAPKDDPDLWRSTIFLFFFEVLADFNFPKMLSKETLSLKVGLKVRVRVPMLMPVVRQSHPQWACVHQNMEQLMKMASRFLLHCVEG